MVVLVKYLSLGPFVVVVSMDYNEPLHIHTKYRVTVGTALH
jgi:hypothetical protein